MTITLNHFEIDKSIIKKDMLDKCKLKNAKKLFKETGAHKEKLVTIFKNTK